MHARKGKQNVNKRFHHYFSQRTKLSVKKKLGTQRKCKKHSPGLVLAFLFSITGLFSIGKTHKRALNLKGLNGPIEIKLKCNNKVNKKMLREKLYKNSLLQQHMPLTCGCQKGKMFWGGGGGG